MFIHETIQRPSKKSTNAFHSQVMTVFNPLSAKKSKVKWLYGSACLAFLHYY